MRGKAQPDGCPAFELIETPVLLISSCGPKYTCTTASWSPGTGATSICLNPALVTSANNN